MTTVNVAPYVDACTPRIEGALGAQMRETLVADARGEGVIMLVIATDQGSAICVAEHPMTESIWEITLLGIPPDQPSEADISLLEVGGDPEADHMFSGVVGRAGKRVSRVDLLLDNGLLVQASLANGWFAAWWPSAARVADSALGF